VETAGRVTAGGPIGNTTVFLVDESGRELPPGVAGELCIAGAGVADGYHDRPELTAARFGVHPEHGRFYRTGDLARWLDDGTLELLGRADRQIKLRGNRIELGEVEAVLLAHPDVAGAAVVVSGDPSADAVLVAYVEAADGAGLADRLWAHARERLPGAAVPHEFVVVERIPLTGNDKVNYPELLRLAAGRARPNSTVDESALDPLVAEVLAAFRELLGRDDVAPDSSFFAHGGHSLLAAKLAQRVTRLTGVRVRLADVFNHPAPAALVAFTRAAGSGA